VKALEAGQPVEKKVYPYQIAYNCIPQVDTFGPTSTRAKRTR